MKIWSNVIVGAGLSGLLLAQRLKQNGQEVLLIDKAKSVGGRMATRRDGESTFDHGAQYSSSQFLDYFNSDQWLVWFQKNEQKKFAFKGGMNKAAKHLANGLEMQLNKKVILLSNNQKNVSLSLESDDKVLADRVYLTCPVPQTTDLLKASQIDYPSYVDKIVYHKALVGLFTVSSTHDLLKKLSYVEDQGRGIFSVSNQQSKYVSQELAITVVMNTKFSENYFDNKDEDNLFLIENCFSSFLHNALGLKDNDYTILRSQLKKWRYSHPANPVEVGFESLSEGKIILIGDGFSGGSLVQAAKSAFLAPL